MLNLDYKIVFIQANWKCKIYWLRLINLRLDDDI